MLAAFAVADAIRPESRDAIRQLHERGIKVAMVTGHAEPVAPAVAKDLGIDTVLAQVLPEEKAKRIEDLQHKGEKGRHGRRRCE